MRLLAAAMLTLLAVPAAAEKVLYCVDTKTSGIKWLDDFPNDTNTKIVPFEGLRFTVTIVSPTIRWIKSAVNSGEYRCDTPISSTDPLGPPHLIFCQSSVGDHRLPFEFFLFRGDKYTHAFLNGQNILGDKEIYVSYGTCTDF